MLTKYLPGKKRSEAQEAASGGQYEHFIVALQERDEKISRLEQTVHDQNARIEALAQALEQAEFRAETLERSYATQLREARERTAVDEQSIAAQQSRIDELEADQKKISRDLQRARARLEPFGPDPASIDELLEGPMPESQPITDDMVDAVDASVDSQTPEEMLSPDVVFADKSE